MRLKFFTGFRDADTRVCPKKKGVFWKLLVFKSAHLLLLVNLFFQKTVRRRNAAVFSVFWNYLPADHNNFFSIGANKDVVVITYARFAQKHQFRPKRG